MDSLQGRLLAAGTLVLAAFLGLTGWAVDRAFRASAEAALQERLQGHVYMLLAAADLRPSGELALAGTLPEARLSTPGSGLYAQVMDADGFPVWRSASLLGRPLTFEHALEPGEARYARRADPAGPEVYTLSFGIAWEGDDGALHRYVFAAGETLGPLLEQVRGFRLTLWGWLAGAALLLLVAQAVILAWGLAPLRRAAREIDAIEDGSRHALGDDYPRELRRLTARLNALLDTQRRNLDRHRNALADLAHSLKTPLAVLRGLSDDRQLPPAWRSQAEAPLARIGQLVDYHLGRAAAAGRTPLAAAVDVRLQAQRLAETLAKVYADKGARCRLDIPADARFHGDAGDLLEVLGNLADNAHKWCRQEVRIGASALQDDWQRGLRLWVEDDGPGLPPTALEALLARGARADTQTPGHGIGLAVVRDIVALYEGTVSRCDSQLGGACVAVTLPASRD